MTSASIMEMSKAGFVPGTTSVKTSAPAPSVQFSDAMEFASSGQQDSAKETVCSAEKVNVHAEKNAARHKEIRETSPEEKTEPIEGVSEKKVSEQLDAKEEAVVKEIAEKLGVSEEEVEQALEILGLSVMDLMSQGNMVALTAQLTGMQTVDVLTDENLFAQITDLTQSVCSQMQELADSLGMNVEQLQALIDEQIQKAEGGAEFKDVVSVQGQVSQLSAEENTPVVEIVNEVAEETLQTQETKGADEEPIVENDEMTMEKAVSEAETVKAETQSDGSSRHKEDGNEAQLAQSNQISQQTVNQMNQAKEMQAEDLFKGQLDAQQTRELIHQISDYVKVHRAQQVTSMEIQLHPAELGSVNLQVVAKDGNISAQLSVQDEAVRAALEGQMMQLRESLQEQGLKIDSVEVTVATHEFEQNLDQQGKEAQEQAAREKKSGRRILDLNELGQEDLEDTEMSDADRLQIEMMRMGGNRLNFRV